MDIPSVCTQSRLMPKSSKEVEREMLKVYPTELLTGTVTSIHKKTSAATSSHSKVFESVLLEQFYGSILETDLQFIDIMKSNRIKSVGCLFISLKKAFDACNPSRLARKLKQPGLSDAYYMLNRKALLRLETMSCRN